MTLRDLAATIVLAMTLPGLGQALSGGMTFPGLMGNWRHAVHTPPHAEPMEAEVITRSEENGVSSIIHAWVRTSGYYHAVVTSTFDTTEVLLSGRGAMRRDWNGFLRVPKGKELARLRTEVFEILVTLLGPPEVSSDSEQVQAEGDTSYAVHLVAPRGDTTIWHIDARSWLPWKSSRRGEDAEVTTTYGDWRQSGGREIPFHGLVSEPGKPDYEWTNESVHMGHPASSGYVEILEAGPADTHMSDVVPPISFSFENDHIIFPIRLNGKDSVLFLLDTGADEEIINEPHLSEFGLHPYGNTSTTGGGGSAAFAFARGATFSLPGVEIRGQHVAVLDESGLERAYGMKLGGILGYEFISRFVIEIDYERRLLLLHDPGSWTYGGKGYVVPVVFDEGIPFAEAALSAPGTAPVPASMVLDFGAAETMTLTSPFVREHDLIRLAGTNIAVNKIAGLENQFFAQNNVRGRFDALSMGGLTVKTFPANMSVNTKGAYASTEFSGTVGEGIFHRYHVFLDYARDRVIFEPTAETDKPYADRKTYGLMILASGADLHTYTITGVRNESPAEKDGFRKGDVVVSLDGRNASQFTLGELRSCLSHDAEHHDLRVVRDAREVALPVDVKLISLEKN